LGIFSAYASCVQDAADAYIAHQSGERNPGALYLEATGLKDTIVAMADVVNQMNSDVSTVFLNAPFEDRGLPSIQSGTFAVGAAAAIVGIPSGQAAIGSAEVPITGSELYTPENEFSGLIFRGGGTNPGNLTPQPSD
jgi:hypothetical protein